MSPAHFEHRFDAGHRLAEHLADLDLHRPLVLGIPRGGIEVAAAIAQHLDAELDVALARKIPAPDQPEYALGAVAEDGSVHLNPAVDPGIDRLQQHIERQRRRQLQDIAARRERLRNARPPADPARRDVIITDDGIATGSTMTAALRALRAQRPGSIVLAVPVAAPSRLEPLRRLADRTVCIVESEHLAAVGRAYRDFTQTTDDRVAQLLRHADAHAD